MANKHYSVNRIPVSLQILASQYDYLFTAQGLNNLMFGCWLIGMTEECGDIDDWKSLVGEYLEKAVRRGTRLTYGTHPSKIDQDLAKVGQRLWDLIETGELDRQYAEVCRGCVDFDFDRPDVTDRIQYRAVGPESYQITFLGALHENPR